MQSQDQKDNLWEKLIKFEGTKHHEKFPKISIIIPAYNCSQSIALTLDSVLYQDYPRLEIIVIDAGSTDRTLEIIKGYQDLRLRIYSVTGYLRYGMINRGISQASGLYVNILFPGDFYIHRRALRLMMDLAVEHEYPHLVYCGTLLRDGISEVKILFRSFTLNLLKYGQQPTSLQSCWFHQDVFKMIGKFDPTFRLRGGYDFLCRLMLNKRTRFAATSRVLTDYDLRLVTRRMVIRHFWETLKIIRKYFGWKAVLSWLIRQKDVSRFVRLWLRNLKIVFVGHQN